METGKVGGLGGARVSGLWGQEHPAECWDQAMRVCRS
jgi:hypothetical protein